MVRVVTTFRKERLTCTCLHWCVKNTHPWISSQSLISVLPAFTAMLKDRTLETTHQSSL